MSLTLTPSRAQATLPAQLPLSLPTSDRLEFSSIAGGLRRRLPGIVGAIAVAVVLALAAIALLPPSYQAQTKILVRVGREQVAPLEQSGTRFNNFILTQRVETTNDEVEMLRRPQLLDEVFIRLERLLDARKASMASGPGRLQPIKDWLQAAVAPVREALIEANILADETAQQRLRRRFAAALDVAVVRETNVLVVGFTWDDPVFAAQALNAYTEAYQQEHVKLQSNVAGMAELYRTQASRTETELAASTQALQQFLAERGSSDPAAERQVVIVRLQELEQELNEAANQQQQAIRQIDVLRVQSTQVTDWLETPPIAQTNLPGLSDIDAKHVDLIVARDRLLTQYRPDARPVTDLEAQLARLRQSKLDALLNFLDARKAAAQQGWQRATDQITRMRARLESLTQLQNRSTELQDQRHQLIEQLKGYRGQAEYLGLQQALNDKGLASVTVLGAATPPDRPIAPRKSLIMTLSVALAALLALGHAALAELHDTKLRNQAQVVSYLGIASVTMLPRARRR